MIAEYWEMIVFRSNELLFYSMSYHSLFVTLNDITFGGNIYIHNFLQLHVITYIQYILMYLMMRDKFKSVLMRT